MTLEEAKQLKPGDKVLVELEVTNPPDKYGDLRVLFNGVVEFVSHHLIHAKIGSDGLRRDKEGGGAWLIG